MDSLKRNCLSKVRFIIGIAAGKGGVGKSSLTINLAQALNRMGLRIGVLDADVYGPSVQKMLPEDKLPVQCSDGMLPAEKGGIKIMTVSYFYHEEQAIVVRAPIANSIIKQFLHSVEWGELDCLLIDFPPGTGDIQLTLMQEGALSGAVVITTPQEVALLDVSKAVQMFHQMQIPIIGLIENMSYFQDPMSERRFYPLGQDGGRRLCQREGLPFLGQIPIDAEISRCGDEGVSLFDSSQGAGVAKIVENLAKQVLEQLEAFERLEGNYLKNISLQWSAHGP